MTHRWLVIDLAAPLMSFGGVAIDQVGPTRDFPALSMVTGLLANALGWDRRDRAAHQRLQDRLVLASAILRAGQRVTDSQNVQMSSTDRGWTTWGEPEGRGGGSADGIHRRSREYFADANLRCVLRLRSDDDPTLDTLAEALQNPVRPLFIGRKACLPTRALFGGWAEGADAADALRSAGCPPGVRAQWPVAEGPEGDSVSALPDLRNWDSGLHGGTRRLTEGRLPGAQA